ncbi:MAG: phosphatidylglycerophosphatase A [Candidatus Omnitrophica bacterium]|nr:phosphatidylglycerophosphatase A [Candidatus Omnitrophota bacterium]
MKSGILFKLIGTVFGIGYIPRIPGTAASLAAVFVVLLVRDERAVLAIALVSTLLGFAAAGGAEKALQKKDDQHIVIDEFAGMMLSMLFIPAELKFVIPGFVLFRIMDILKPFPAYRLQSLNGSSGIMLDDITAAFYTNALLELSRLSFH